jgi:PAS domain S-box-containing protein
MWERAVAASGSAVALVDLSNASFLAVSAPAADLLGTTVERAVGLSYLDIVDAPNLAREAMRLARDGVLDGTQTRRRLRRPDGSSVDVRATGWIVRSDAGPDLGLWMAFETGAADYTDGAEEIVAPSFRTQPRAVLEGDRLTVDADWRITHIRASAGSLLGRPADELHGTSFIELIHPFDSAVFLFAMARATTDRSARAVIRLRHYDGTWQPVLIAPMVLRGNGVTPLAVVLASEERNEAPVVHQTVDEIPDQLRYIADHIESARVLAGLKEASAALGMKPLPDLTPRQWEIVSRLLRGERVTTIAAAMFVSRSTVRNHLSAVFAKVGVHSQEELLALYRNRQAGSAISS